MGRTRACRTGCALNKPLSTHRRRRPGVSSVQRLHHTPLTRGSSARGRSHARRRGDGHHLIGRPKRHQRWLRGPPHSPSCHTEPARSPMQPVGSDKLFRDKGRRALYPLPLMVAPPWSFQLVVASPWSKGARTLDNQPKVKIMLAITHVMHRDDASISHPRLSPKASLLFLRTCIIHSTYTG